MDADLSLPVLPMTISFLVLLMKLSTLKLYNQTENSITWQGVAISVGEIWHSLLSLQDSLTPRVNMAAA